jgi:hypothetical protein
MTENELLNILRKSADFPEAGDVPDMDKVLEHIAEWAHIAQPGFARSDCEHMALECHVLSETLKRTRWRLDEMVVNVKDEEE